MSFDTHPVVQSLHDQDIKSVPLAQKVSSSHL
jgi:hypothetical protein